MIWRGAEEASNGSATRLWVGQLDNWLKHLMKEQLENKSNKRKTFVQGE